MFTTLCLAISATLLLQETADVGAAAAAPDIEISILGGKSIRGRLSPATGARIGLETEGFSEPLIVQIDALDAIECLQEMKSAADTRGLFSFELSGGEQLHGRILGLTNEAWRIDAIGIGTVSFPRSVVTHARSLGSSSILFNGPHGLAGWTSGKARTSFATRGNSLTSTSPAARIERDLGLDHDRMVEIELSWSATPRFRVELGRRAKKSKRSGAVTVEAWGESLVAWSIRGKGLDIVELSQQIDAESELSLGARVTQAEITFLDANGRELGTLARPANSGPLLAVVNDGDALTLRKLRVIEGLHAHESITLEDALITGFDADENAFTAGGETIAAGAVTEILGGAHPAPGEVPDQEQAPIDGTTRPQDGVTVRFRDGRALTGAFLETDGRSATLQCAWSPSPLQVALDGLDRIDVHRPSRTAKRRATARSFVVTAGGEVPGELESIETDGNVVWQPAFAEQTAEIAPAAVERIIVNRATAYFASKRTFPHYIVLRSGESYRCRLISIDEEHVRIDTPFGADRQVDVALVKAVEFDQSAMDRFRKAFEEKPKDNGFGGFGFGGAERARVATSEGFDGDSLRRALALPRKYKKRRFEHLVIARTGDFMRTSVQSWSKEGVETTSLAGSNRVIPADRLAAVVWLESAQAKTLSGETSGAASRQARIILDETTLLQLKLSRVTDDTLHAQSDVLGDVTLPLSHIESIEFKADPKSPRTHYDDWTLKPMREPFPDAPEPAPTVDSPATGAAAPKTSGVDLEGSALDLADYAGKVVLLQFWGHW